jgi:shikimate dehydrogenase
MNASPEITGLTRIFGIVADPIHHVRTPQRLNEMMRQSGSDAVMVPMHVAPTDLKAHLDVLRRWQNFGGFIATVPHKTAMVTLCDRVSDRARAIGAANAIRREPDGSLVADMLDGVGFVDGLKACGIEPHGTAVYLAGAGGAANAIAFALAEAGVGQLTIYNRTRSRAEDLVARLERTYSDLRCVVGSEDPSGHQMAVNGTSLGLRPGDPIPIDVTKLDRGTLVAEIIMEPEMTPLLEKAKAAGCRIHLGHHMLTKQLEAMASFLGMGK